MRLLSTVFTGALGVALLGCAHAAKPASEGERPASAEFVSAQRMYGVAEGMFARGDYGGAERMLAHAIVQLPPTPQNDELRHRLIMRLSHVQMVYAERTGTEDPLGRADEMLERYLAKHEALFRPSAATQRDEIFEQLGQVGLAQERIERRRRSQPATKVAELDDDVADAHAGDQLDAAQGLRRKVRVRGSRYGNHTEAEIRERFDDPHYDPRRGLWMTRAWWVEYSEPRAVVRLERNKEARARAWGRTVVAEARPGLQRCYTDAFSRVPVSTRRVEVTFATQADGSVGAPRIAKGGLGDGEGDACVVASLRKAAKNVEDPDASTPGPTRLSLLFMFEEQRFIDEASGEAASRRRFGSSWRDYNPDIVEQRDMPSIDAPANIPDNLARPIQRR